MMPFFTECVNSWWVRAGMYEAWWVWGFWLFSAFLFGCCIGSFLNVCIWRMPQGESVSDAPSHCPKCGALIRWYDNIPIYSYLRLWGRCRNCRERISPRYIIIEALTGLLFAAALAKTGWSEETPLRLLLLFPMIMLIVTTTLIDWEHRLIPDQTTYPAMIAGVVVSSVFPAVWNLQSYWASGLYSLLSLAVCGVLLSLFAILGRKVARQDVLGWGDVKFMMATGALLGLWGAFFTLLAGALGGMVYGIALGMKRRRKLRRVAIPFGPFLAGGALLWIFCGERVLRLYFQWMQS